MVSDWHHNPISNIGLIHLGTIYAVCSRSATCLRWINRYTPSARHVARITCPVTSVAVSTKASRSSVLNCKKVWVRSICCTESIADDKCNLCEAGLRLFVRRASASFDNRQITRFWSVVGVAFVPKAADISTGRHWDWRGWRWPRRDPILGRHCAVRIVGILLLRARVRAQHVVVVITELDLVDHWHHCRKMRCSCGGDLLHNCLQRWRGLYVQRRVFVWIVY